MVVVITNKNQKADVIFNFKKVMTKKKLFIFITLLQLFKSLYVDPSDVFLGALHRPILEIINPENGQVLDENNIEISSNNNNKTR